MIFCLKFSGIFLKEKNFKQLLGDIKYDSFGKNHNFAAPSFSKLSLKRKADFRTKFSVDGLYLQHQNPTSTFTFFFYEIQKHSERVKHKKNCLPDLGVFKDRLSSWLSILELIDFFYISGVRTLPK